jgi:hypothetical protein
LGPIPNPQSPIPKPKSVRIIKLFYFFIENTSYQISIIND